MAILVSFLEDTSVGIFEFYKQQNAVSRDDA